VTTIVRLASRGSMDSNAALHSAGSSSPPKLSSIAKSSALRCLLIASKKRPSRACSAANARRSIPSGRILAHRRVSSSKPPHGFVALSAALWSLGLPAVEFAQDADMTDHDDAVAPALFSPDGDIEPFAQRLATRIEHARKPAT
jgi:hypothetical protein